MKAVGEGFLNKLNSTATTYYPGGFNPGQLPDSMYAGGGKVPNRRNKMARGKRAPRRGRVGRAPARKMASGGRTRPAPRGRAMARGGRPQGRKFQAGGPGGQCPAGTDRTADGRCTPMGS